MKKALKNREKIANIRRRMLAGELSYDEAKAEAKPILDDINKTALLLAKKHNTRPGKISFAAVMR